MQLLSIGKQSVSLSAQNATKKAFFPPLSSHWPWDEAKLFKRKLFNLPPSSSFFQIEQEVVEKWPLTLIDNQNKRKKIFLKAGEMIMFESSSMPLGRQYPLNGTFYDELLVYFPPLNRTEILSHNYYAEDVWI